MLSNLSMTIIDFTIFSSNLFAFSTEQNVRRNIAVFSVICVTLSDK